MTDIQPNDPKLPFSPRVLYIIIGLLGLIASVLFLTAFLSFEIHDKLAWLFSGLGLLTAILIGITLYIIQQSKKITASLQSLRKESEIEMIKLMKAEEGRQNLEKALLQGQKLQAIGTLAGGIAHDFNNILYAVKGYIEMAREDLDQETIIYRNLGKVLEASERGQDLIARILAFSRRQHLDYKPINLQTTIENALALLEPTIPASVIINHEKTLENCMVAGNQTQLHQVIVNIVNNAVDAMDGEGTISFKLTMAAEYDELLKRIPNRNNSQYCKIEISDTGCGMSHSTMERIFEPFYTTKEVGKGTGLGLSTVYSIIVDHQGIISVHSQLGHGTTFIILLPMLTMPAYHEMQ